MASTYPTGVDVFPVDITDDTDSQSGTPRTGLEGFLAGLLNDHGEAIFKIETELGTTPKGTAPSVRERFEQGERKAQCKAASTANVTLPPGGTTLTIDAVSLINDDRVLLKDQTAPADNGVYTVSGVGSSVLLTRALDMNTDVEIADIEVGVAQGTASADTRWRCVTSLPITLGTTAIRWSRTSPPYASAQRNPWDMGAGVSICSTMDRESGINLVPQTAITAICSFHGGLVIPAGRLITNINAFCTAAGAGAVTTFWWAIVRLSDRTVLQRTANSTSLPTINAVHTRALQATLTLDYDTPSYIALGTQVATTSPSFAGVTGLATPNFSTPLTAGNSTTAPTSTPPTVGAVLGAPAAGNTGRIYAWLS